MSSSEYIAVAAGLAVVWGMLDEIESLLLRHANQFQWGLSVPF
ncbi:hypothetical protein [Spiribacter pallidus]|uniref:Uncharacterized protein n=1 Tax=Spiribacter pallidus TaxID=1987936 RepID=A0ABV3TCH0_9GAMM